MNLVQFLKTRAVMPLYMFLIMGTMCAIGMIGVIVAIGEHSAAERIGWQRTQLEVENARLKNELLTSELGRDKNQGLLISCQAERAITIQVLKEEIASLKAYVARQ